MDLWNKLRTPPKSALKPIQGGRMRGKTDISPQWRLQAMTEIFGACGTGWRYEIKKLRTEDGANDEKMAFALVDLYYKTKDQWSEPVTGIGGNMIIEKESRGLYSNDEAYKMAVTDALSVAFKAIGMAADVYMGMTDSKYEQPAPQPTPKKEDPLKAECASLAQKYGLTDAENKKLWEASGRNYSKMKELIEESGKLKQECGLLAEQYGLGEDQIKPLTLEAGGDYHKLKELIIVHGERQQPIQDTDLFY